MKKNKTKQNNVSKYTFNGDRSHNTFVYEIIIIILFLVFSSRLPHHSFKTPYCWMRHTLKK